MVLSHATVWTIVHHYIRKEVCNIPGITVFVLPILLAAMSCVIAYFTNFSTLGIVFSLVMFAVIAPLLDRRLLGAAKTLSKIKHQNLPIDADAQET